MLSKPVGQSAHLLQPYNPSALILASGIQVAGSLHVFYKFPQMGFVLHCTAALDIVWSSELAGGSQVSVI